MPLSHPPGHAQADFGEALAIIGGVERKIHFLVMDLPHSDACFLKAYPAETTEAFCDAHVAAFAFFGGVPCRSCTTTRGLPWPAFWETANANEPGCSQNWCPIICLRIDLAARARGMTKVKSRGWWGTLGATSWCPSPGSPALMISMLIWLNNAASAWMTNCAVTKARLVNGLPVMRNGSSPCQLFLMTPATSNQFGSAHCPSCGIAATIILFRRLRSSGSSGAGLCA